MAIPKYEQVKEYLIEYIQKEDLKYGDSLPTESEMMRMFSVSRHTIRRALSDLINQGWLFTLQGSGTFVADPNADRQLQGKMIGVITTYFKDYIFPDILSGIDDVVSTVGYSILLGTTKNNIARERVVLKNMLSSQLAGLIVEPTKSVYPNHNLDLYKELASRGIPVVYMHATYRDFESSYVIEDDEYAGYIATKHLLDLGHEKIYGLFKQDDMQGHGRYKGFVRAFKEAEVELSDDLVHWFVTEEMKHYGDAKRLERWMEGHGDITALVCYNDQIAIELMDGFKQLGYNIPDDISIVSFDNANVAEKSAVKLTTVAHPKEKLGRAAGEVMLDLLNNRVGHHEIKMIPELIIRESTRART